MAFLFFGVFLNLFYVYKKKRELETVSTKMAIISLMFLNVDIFKKTCFCDKTILMP